MLRFSRYPEIELTWFVMEGDTAIEEWIEVHRSYDRFGQSRLEFYDFRNVSRPFSAEEVRALVDFSVSRTHLRPPNGRTAAVVSDALRFGLARMFQLQGEIMGISWEIRAFYTIEEALDWLGSEVRSLVLDKREDGPQ